MMAYSKSQVAQQGYELIQFMSSQLSFVSLTIHNILSPSMTAKRNFYSIEMPAFSPERQSIVGKMPRHLKPKY